MIKTLTCIDCPKSCSLSVETEDSKVISVTGEKCPKGKIYAVSEIEKPVRILTSTVLSQGLPIKMIPVRTNKPIPKDKLIEAMDRIKRIKISKPVEAGDIIEENFLGLGVNLVATRNSY